MPWSAAHRRRRSACPGPRRTRPPAAGVAAVALGVPGGDDGIEPEGLGQGAPGRPARWWPAPRGRPSARWAASTASAQGWTRSTRGSTARLPARRVASAERPRMTAGRRPGQRDEGHRLAEPVVEAVEKAVAGQVRPAAGTPSATMAGWNTGPLADRSRVRSRSTNTAPGAAACPTLPPARPGRVRPGDGWSSDRMRTGREPRSPWESATGPRTRQRDRQGGKAVPLH